MARLHLLALFICLVLSTSQAKSLAGLDTLIVPSPDEGQRISVELSRAVAGTITLPSANTWRPAGLVRATSRGITNTTLLNRDGSFSFPTVEYGAVSLSADLLIATDFNVTTYDLLLVGNHILQETPFTHPFQWISADATGDGTVSARDISRIREVILGQANFPDGRGVVLIDEAFAFTDPMAPLLDRGKWLPTLRSGLDDELAVDLKAIKLGDVNGSSPNLSQNPGTQFITIADQALRANQRYFVKLDLPSEILAGFQLGLQFSGDLLIHPADINITVDTSFVDGVIRIISTEELLPSETYLVLELVPREAGNLSDLLELDKSFPAESYAADPLSLNRLELAWLASEPSPAEAATISLFPNPTSGDSNLRVLLSSGFYELEVIDVSGRSFVERQIEAQQTGFYNFRIDGADWPAGNYFLRLEGNGTRRHTKLIIQH